MATRYTLPASPGIKPAGVAAPAEWEEPAITYLKGLGASTLSGMTELFGVTLPGAEEFRREQPIVGTVSQMAGIVVPYGGWFAGARRIPQLVNLANKVAKIEKSPFLAGAAREAVMLTPFEVGRVGVSQVLPWSDESAVDMTSAALFDLALGSGIGGALHSFAAAGRRAARTQIPGVDLAAPPPLQLRRMKQMLAEHEAKGGVLTPEQQGAVVNRIKDMDQKARQEVASGERYLSKVNGNEALTRLLNSFFTIKDAGTLKKRMFAAGEKAGFATEDEWRRAAKYNGLPDNFAETGRYFRELTFKPTGGDAAVAEVKKLFDSMIAGKISKADFDKLTTRMASGKYAAERARRVDKELRAGMQSVGFGWLMGKEEGGLFVLAKKTSGKFGKGTVADRWVLFKSDMPGTYLPKHKAWSDMVIEKNSWQTAAQPLEGIGGSYGTGRDLLRIFPTDFHETVNTVGRLKALLPKNLGRSSSELVRGMADSAREYLAPAVAQFRKSALGKQIFITAKAMHDYADMQAHQMVFGRLAPGKGNAFLQAVTPSKLDPDVDSISSILSGLSDDQINEVVKLSNDLVDPARYDELVAAGTLSAPARAAADRLEVLADVVDIDHQALAQFLGVNAGQRAKGNLGLVRKWEGDARILLRDESGKAVAVVAGKTKRGAQQTAARIVSENPGLHIAEQIDVSKTKGLSNEQRAALPKEITSTIGKAGGTPGLRGFKGDYEVIDRKELLQDFQEAYASKFKWQAERGIEDLLAQKRAVLNETDPTTTRILDARLRDLRGEQSGFAQWQNDFADKVLAPMIGPNSASKIVQATNTGLAIWHLGMGNIAHPIMNMLTFVSNVTPEIAMIIGASAQDLGGYYSHFLAGGTRGPIAAGAILSPGKILIQSFRRMATPDEQLQRFYARAGEDATTQPRVAEEFIGQNASRVQDLKGAMASPGGFASWLKELAIWMPANSERMSRIHAFTVGHIVGKDVLGIVDEEKLYRFAKEFTERTMFNYTTADRPRIFTTPAGSAMGLFKTWMMNYMAAMAEYSGQAMKGNWAPIAWQTAGTAAVGGVAATPLYWIADGFSRAFTDESLLQQTYDNLSEGPADALMFGMPAALTGISLYSQSSSPLSNPQRDASMLWSMVLMNRAAALGRVAGLGFDNWKATGQHPGSSAAVRDAMFQALAPSTVARAVSAFSGEDMIRSLASGHPLISSVPLGDRLLYALKLNPVELDRAMAVADELYRDRAKERAAVVRLGRAFAEAQDNGDSGGINEIMMQALAWGIDPSKVLQSAMRREQLGAEPLIERTFSPQKVAPYLPVLGQ